MWVLLLSSHCIAGCTNKTLTGTNTNTDRWQTVISQPGAPLTSSLYQYLHSVSGTLGHGDVRNLFFWSYFVLFLEAGKHLFWQPGSSVHLATTTAESNLSVCGYKSHSKKLWHAKCLLRVRRTLCDCLFGEKWGSLYRLFFTINPFLKKTQSSGRNHNCIFRHLHVTFITQVWCLSLLSPASVPFLLQPAPPVRNNGVASPIRM